MSKFLQNLLLTLIVGGLISSPVLAEAHAGRRVHRHSRELACATTGKVE
jgi:hypothetical protein